MHAGDAHAIFNRWAQDPECTRYLSWSPHESIDQTHEHLVRQAQLRREGREITWAICERSDDSPWGSISARPSGHRVEIGYVLAREKWGRGLMPEAAQAVVQALWEAEHVARVEAHCAVANIASERVMHKIGMRLEGTLRRYASFPNLPDPPHDLHIYASIRGEA